MLECTALNATRQCFYSNGCLKKNIAVIYVFIYLFFCFSSLHFTTIFFHLKCIDLATDATLAIKK